MTSTGPPPAFLWHAYQNQPQVLTILITTTPIDSAHLSLSNTPATNFSLLGKLLDPDRSRKVGLIWQTKGYAATFAPCRRQRLRWRFKVVLVESASAPTKPETGRVAVWEI